MGPKIDGGASWGNIETSNQTDKNEETGLLDGIKSYFVGLGTRTVCTGSSNLLAATLYWLSLPVHAASVFDTRYVSEARHITLRKPIKMRFGRREEGNLVLSCALSVKACYPVP